MDIRPLHDRIIVRRQDDDGEQRVGGIIVPDSAKEKPHRGTVVAVGDGRLTDDGTRIPLDIKTGDLVLFGKYASADITIHGEEFLILREGEVLAVFDDSAASPSHS
jgi:chaperonin GroES